MFTIHAALSPQVEKSAASLKGQTLLAGWPSHTNRCFEGVPLASEVGARSDIAHELSLFQ